MNRRSLISFILLAVLCAHTTVPCCLAGVAAEFETTQADQIRISLCCHCCPHGATQSNGDPLPTGDDSDRATCPICLGSVELKLISSTSEDLRHLQLNAVQWRIVITEESLSELLEEPDYHFNNSQLTGCDVVNCLLL